MKIKIIDLLNKIANNEELPKKLNGKDRFMNIVILIDFIIKIVGQCIEIFIQKVIV